MPRDRARRPVPRRPVTARQLRSMTAANEAAYRQMLGAGGARVCWDYVVLTAANGKQAEGYRHQLRLREGSFFPKAQRTLVVPDPPGPRVGSGGATLGVMRALSRRFPLQPPHLHPPPIPLVPSPRPSHPPPLDAA